MRRLVLALVVTGLAFGGGLWRANSEGGGSTLVGTLRVISVQADSTPPGPVSAQQALAIITAKLTELEPNVAWTASTPRWTVNLISGMTQVTDAVDGHVLYQRPWPIDAWVAQIHMGTNVGFGIVADSLNTPLNCKQAGCDPAGTLLGAQTFTGLGVAAPTCSAPASNPQQYVQCETK